MIKNSAFIFTVNDHGDCNVTQFSIAPTSGVKGTTFTIDATYVVVNGTGTGEIAIDIDAPDRVPLGASFLWESKKPGTYSERITVEAKPDPSCDPTQGTHLSIINENLFQIFLSSRTM